MSQLGTTNEHKLVIQNKILTKIKQRKPTDLELDHRVLLENRDMQYY